MIAFSVYRTGGIRIMKIYRALKIAGSCGFRTVGEALLNIQLNASNMFGYTESSIEVAELTRYVMGWLKIMMNDYEEYSEKVRGVDYGTYNCKHKRVHRQ